MSDRAEDLNEWRSEQYAKNAKSYEPKVWLTVEEAKEIAFKLKELSEGYFLSTGNIDSRSIEWSIVLNERIEQAEVQDAND